MLRAFVARRAGAALGIDDRYSATVSGNIGASASGVSATVKLLRNAQTVATTIGRRGGPM